MYYLYLLRLWHLLICWFSKYWWQFPRLRCGVHSRWKGGGGYIMEIQYIICKSVCIIAATEDYFFIPTPSVYFSSGSQQSRLSYYSLIFCRCFVYLFVCFSFDYFWDCFCSRRQTINQSTCIKITITLYYLNLLFYNTGKISGRRDTDLQ